MFEQDLSSMAEAAERFRREMDAMRRNASNAAEKDEVEMLATVVSCGEKVADSCV